MEDFQIEDGVLVRYNGKDEEVTVPEGVTAIGKEAFCGAASTLKKVVLPNTVTEIGEFAFASCTRLSEVVLDEELTEIGRGAFFLCLGLRFFDDPPMALNKIGDYAYWGSGLEKVRFGYRQQYVGEGAFAACDRLFMVTVPKTLKGGLSKKGLKRVFVGPEDGAAAFADRDPAFKDAAAVYRKNLERFQKVHFALF